MSGYAPTPLNPRDVDSLVTHLSSGDCVRIMTTELLRTILQRYQSGLPESYFATLATAFEEYYPIAEVIDDVLSEAVRNLEND